MEWVTNICVNYGHIIFAIMIYNKFKESDNAGSRKYKILTIGVIVIFGWMFMANVLAI
jgi:hypothetical protein